MLRRLASLVAVLLLLMTAAPVMACVTQPQMSQAENACCRMMHGDCGEMAKTGCCRVEVKDQQPQAAAHGPVVSFQLIAFAVVVLDLAAPGTGHPARWMAPDEYSPPQPRSTRPTVLRL